ncbi:MAG: hypothetical protein ACLU7M_11800 [Mediterraneibacter gnavus]|uniref:hypothetical protein n=1 Tax=Mediterraneibacter gnavus TaxID=33038 RepID=UPI001FA8C153|nr:hypothetical protein [Mediterraneibacter gnavus]MDU6436606.1 hypothetical protein [Lachnospiraceae bacterium]
MHVLELPKLAKHQYPETELLSWMQFINAETEEEFLQEMGETKEHVLFRLKEKFKLSDTDANQYLEKYWKE